jgi:hypothetical protein
MTRPWAGMDSGRAGVPSRLRRCVMNVENAGRREATSRCFWPGAGLRIWIPPHCGRKKEFFWDEDCVDSRWSGRKAG